MYFDDRATNEKNLVTCWDIYSKNELSFKNIKDRLLIEVDTIKAILD